MDAPDYRLGSAGARPVTLEHRWTLGEVINALLSVGLLGPISESSRRLGSESAAHRFAVDAKNMSQSESAGFSSP